MKMTLFGALALLCLAAPAFAGKPAAKPAAPAVHLLTLDNKPALLADYTRKVTVACMFSTQFTNLEVVKRCEALHQHFKDDKDVAFVAVCVDRVKGPDDLQVIRELTQPLGLTMPVVVDKDIQLLGLANGVDYGGKTPGNARMYTFVVLDAGFNVREKGGIPLSQPLDEFVKDYASVVERAKKPAP